MKINEVVVKFPSAKAHTQSKKGLVYDEITDKWYPKQPHKEEFMVVDDTKNKAYSTHANSKSAEIAVKKLKLKRINAHVEAI